jgi:hypothetical protein
MMTGMIRNSLLAALFAAGFFAQASRPMSEMEGDCANFAMPLSREMALWDRPELRVQGAEDDKSTAVLPPDRKVSLSLYPSKKVSLPLKPEKDFSSKGEITYAGLASIDVKQDGIYRVSLGSKIWIDVIEPANGEANAKIVPSANFEMQTGCKKVFKAVEYRLSAGKKYLLQISSSKTPAANILTTLVK